MTSGCIKTACDVVFDMTNDSQKEQVDLDLIDDEEASCDALQRMTIGDIRFQDPSNQPQGQSSNDTTPHEQGLDQDKHEEEDEQHDQAQEESNDQGGDKDDEDNGEVPPHPRVHHNVQRDHPINNILGDIEKGVTTNILGDIEKGVTTRSRVANFCEYCSFVSSFKPFKIEDALHDLDWVVTMQEELNNFKQNKV
jgi:hypothetical protein